MDSQIAISLSTSHSYSALGKVMSCLLWREKCVPFILRLIGIAHETGILWLMDFKQGLDWTKNTSIVLKAKLCIKLKVIMSSFIFRLSSGQKSVASYCKMGR